MSRPNDMVNSVPPGNPFVEILILFFVVQKGEVVGKVGLLAHAETEPYLNGMFQNPGLPFGEFKGYFLQMFITSE